MKIKSVDWSFRVGLDDASGVSDLHRGGDPAVEASSCPRFACFGTDPRGDAVEELRGGWAERAQRFQSDKAKTFTFFYNFWKML